MKFSSIITALFLSIIYFHVSAQDALFFMTNSKPIDENRYEDIKYSPYYFDDWVIGSLTDKSGEVITEITLNYNGYSDNVEIKKGNKFIELDAKEYAKVEVLASDNPKQFKSIDEDTVVFKGKVHPRFRNRIVQIIHEGKNITFINDFDVTLSSKEINNVGKAIEFKQFVKRSTYYLLKGDDLKVVRLNRRRILEALGNNSSITKFMKSERININSHADLAKLMAYYDRLQE